MARKTFVTLSRKRTIRQGVLMSFTGHRSFKTIKRCVANTHTSISVAMARGAGARMNDR